MLFVSLGGRVKHLSFDALENRRNPIAALLMLLLGALTTFCHDHDLFRHDGILSEANWDSAEKRVTGIPQCWLVLFRQLW
jgi:hypothetical protein